MAAVGHFAAAFICRAEGEQSSNNPIISPEIKVFNYL